MTPRPSRSFIQRLIETDDNGRIIYATPEAAELFGKGPRELVGGELFRLFPRGAADLRGLLRASAPEQSLDAVTVMTNSGQSALAAVHVTVTRVDGRRLQWRLVRADEA